MNALYSLPEHLVGSMRQLRLFQHEELLIVLSAISFLMGPTNSSLRRFTTYEYTPRSLRLFWHPSYDSLHSAKTFPPPRLFPSSRCGISSDVSRSIRGGSSQVTPPSSVMAHEGTLDSPPHTFPEERFGSLHEAPEGSD